MAGHNPLIGTWLSNDGETEYTILPEGDNFTLRIRQLPDGEEFECANGFMAGDVLRFVDEDLEGDCASQQEFYLDPKKGLVYTRTYKEGCTKQLQAS